MLCEIIAQLLDLLEVYLSTRLLPDGRRMGYLRIDGSTSLEDRQASTLDTNSDQFADFPEE